jgi:hypothetical protein
VELHRILGGIDAPAELVRWVTENAASPDAAWADCPRGEWRIWLGACLGAPVEVVIEAAAVCVLETAEAVPEGATPIHAAIEAAVGGGSAEDCRLAAAACEEAAQSPPAHYRGGSQPRHAALLRAAALVARAGEALASASARREGDRFIRAQRSGAMLGVGTAAMMGTDPGPLRLDAIAAAGDPVHGELVYAVAAAGEAIAELERAAGPQNDRIRDAIAPGAAPG